MHRKIIRMELWKPLSLSLLLGFVSPLSSFLLSLNSLSIYDPSFLSLSLEKTVLWVRAPREPTVPTGPSSPPSSSAVAPHRTPPQRYIRSMMRILHMAAKLMNPLRVFVSCYNLLRFSYFT